MLKVLNYKKNPVGIQASTEDATVTDVFVLEIQEGIGGYINLDMCARSEANSAAYKLQIRVFRAVAGAVAINVAVLNASETDAAWDCSAAAISASEVAIQVTGAAATDIRWLGQAEYQLV